MFDYSMNGDTGHYDPTLSKTPCDIPDENGYYNCPYKNGYAGYASEMCRVCCGLGVDE